MHIVISQFEVENDLEHEVKQAFRQRPHLVENAPGFIRLDVISPHDNPAEIMLITYWQQQTDYETWHKSHHYKDAHQGIPAGLKLKRGATRIRAYEHVSS